MDDPASRALRIDWTDGDLPLLRAADGRSALAFSTREGGVSQGPFSSLNLGTMVGDDADLVRRNRVSLCERLGVDPQTLIVPAQVHGTVVREVGRDDCGRGAPGADTAVAGTDGLLTRAVGATLFVSFADCVPVWISAADAEGRPAVTLVHAGWRGMLAGIVGTAARLLRRNGAFLRAAVIGPAICRSCFTVGDDVGRRFAGKWPAAWAGGRVDLAEVARIQLLDEGLTPPAIVSTGLCTCCDERFFSHRRDGGLTGRQAALAWIRPAVKDGQGGLG